MTSFEIIMTVGLSVLVVLSIIIIAVFVFTTRKRNGSETEKAIANLQGQVTVLTNTIDNRIASVDESKSAAE